MPSEYSTQKEESKKGVYHATGTDVIIGPPSYPQPKPAQQKHPQYGPTGKLVIEMVHHGAQHQQRYRIVEKVLPIAMYKGICEYAQKAIDIAWQHSKARKTHIEQLLEQMDRKEQYHYYQRDDSGIQQFAVQTSVHAVKISPQKADAI